MENIELTVNLIPGLISMYSLMELHIYTVADANVSNELKQVIIKR